MKTSPDDYRRALVHAEAPREYRTGFDAGYDRMEKDEVYDRLEAAEGTYFYRVNLAPGEGRHVDADLHDWARRVSSASAG